MPPATRHYDLVLFGASGYTGRLVAEVLHAATQGPDARARRLRWALAGRQPARLAAVRDAIGAGPGLPLLVADAHDAAALASLARRARVVVTTVGPYQRHGEALVTACAEAGADYLDLCGEPLWMARMIERLQPVAARSGARIVFSCGFDSVPFDLGVLVLQQAMQQRFGAPAREVRARVRVLRGGWSGGTVASALATAEAIAREPALAALMADPYALTPGFAGPPQPAPVAGWDDWAGAWCGPFVMAPINTKNVHRTHALRGHPWGADFRYDERQLTGSGWAGRRRAHALARRARLIDRALRLAPVRALAGRWLLPQPGQGPDRAARESGRFELGFTGQTAAGERASVVVSAERDPGYGATSRMLAEAALALLHEVSRVATPGGVWTPGAALGLALVRRLEVHAGVAFSDERLLTPRAA
jgi:short subunit dehydrogenase-like uncharacterized protein